MVMWRKASRRICVILAWTALLFALAVVRWVPPDAQGDLYPLPDAIQYTVSAQNIAQGKGYVVELAGRVHPPRYPIGFPLSLAPVFLLGGEFRHAAIAVFLYAMLFFLPLGLVAWRFFGQGAAFWTILFAGFSPVFVQHSSMIMSESLSLLMIGTIFAIELLGSRGRRNYFCLGLLGGFAALVRYTGLMALIPTGLRALKEKTWRARLTAIGTLAIGVAIFLAPTLCFNAQSYGDLFRNGYHYWQPERYENPGFTFGIDYALNHAVVTWAKHPQPLLIYYARVLSGVDGGLFAPIVPLLALLGVCFFWCKRKSHGLGGGLEQAVPGPGWRKKEKNVEAATLVASVCRLLSYPFFLYLFYSCYHSDESRFLLPALFPTSLLAGMAASQLIQRIRGGGPVLALTLFAVFFFTSKPSAFSRPHLRPQLRYLIVQRYNEFLPNDAVLLTSMDPLYLEAHLRKGTDRVVMALLPDTSHATPIAPHPLPRPSGRAMSIEEYRRWSLDFGAEYPVPVFGFHKAALEPLKDRPIFLDLASHQRGVGRKIRRLGFQLIPLTPPGPRRLYRLQAIP